jgi:muconolactone delta-isomerase
MFRRAIANVLEVPLVNVAKVTASEIETRPGLRRLQSTQTKRYDVAYEVIVPSGMDADAMVEKMNRIAMSGSSESQAFRQVLTSADGIAQVGQIVAKIPARKFEEKATTPLGSQPEPQEEKEENSWTSLVVGSVAVFMALLCGTTTILLLRRKLQPSPTAVPNPKADGETLKSVDGAILPGQEVDAEAGNGQADGAVLLGQGVDAEAGKGQKLDAEAVDGLVLPDEEVEEVPTGKTLPPRLVHL